MKLNKLVSKTIRLLVTYRLSQHEAANFCLGLGIYLTLLSGRTLEDARRSFETMMPKGKTDENQKDASSVV